MSVAGSGAAEPFDNTRPPIDIIALTKLLGDADPPLLRDILGSFLTIMDGTPALLRGFLSSADAVQLTNAAHAAKGAAAFACADQLVDVCSRLEDAARGEDWDEAHRIMPGVDCAFENVKSFIQRILTEAMSEDDTNDRERSF